MKRFMMVCLVGLGLLVAQGTLAAELSNNKDKVSYALGYEIGTNLKNEQIDVDHGIFVQGLKNAMDGKKGTMTEKQVQQTLLAFQKEMLAKRAQEFEGLAKKNAKEGAAFLKENSTKEGVVTLKNGLQYKVLAQGTGNSPKENDTVTVDYEGTTIDGKVFDSSYKRGKPTSFQVDEVIPAWSEALQKMKTGATWMVYAPPSLAYGKTGIGGPIGPEQTLVFKIHLISVEAAKKEKTAGATATSASMHAGGNA